MRETIRLTLVGVLLCGALPPVLAQNGIPWLYDIYEAKQIARQQQRLMLVHFYSDSCAPCRRLEQNVFPNPEVHRALSMNFVPVKINGERARNIAMHYQVDRWPTDVILDPQGRMLYKTVSPQDPARYASLLNGVSADFRSDPRSQFAAYTAPPAQNAPVGYPSAGSYDLQAADRRDYGVPSPTRPNALPSGAMRESYGSSSSDQLSSNLSGSMAAPTSPAPREQLNPYLAATGCAPAAHASPQTGPYDPRSSWSPSAESDDGSVRAAANPASSTPQVDPPPVQPRWSPSQPTWQENRFVSDHPATEAPHAVPAPPTSGTSEAAGAPLAMEGFCTVTLSEQERWVKGDPRWGAVHRGRTYLFLSQPHQQRFLADPDRYSPILSGYDPVRYVDRGELVPGQRRHGMWFRGKIYLFADEESLNRFSAAPDVYAQRAHEIMMSAGRN